MSIDAEDIERFLIAYGDALSAGDGARVASMHELPGLVLSDASSIPLTDRAQLADSVTAAAARFRDAGLSGVRPEYVAIEQLGDELCTADVRWIGVDTEGRASRHKEFALYVLRRSADGEVRIQVTVERPNDRP